MARVLGVPTEYKCETCKVTVGSVTEIDRLRKELEQESKRLDWWFARGLTDSVCTDSVDLWWADEEDGDVVERVTHGVDVRDALDRAMRGQFDA